MEMRSCSVHQINSLIGSVKVMEVNQAGRHTPLSHGMTSLIGWRLTCQYHHIVQSPTSQTPVSSRAERFLFSSSVLSLTLSPHTIEILLCYFISFDIFSSIFPLPSQTAECLSQALDPFQHAVQFMWLLLQKLYSFHFHPEHSPHPGL